MIPKNGDAPFDECDFFDGCRDNNNKNKTPIPWIKYALIGGGVFTFLGIGYYFFIKTPSPSSSRPPIMVYPIDQPLKIKPDLEISEEKTKPKPQNIIYDKISKKNKNPKKQTSTEIEKPTVKNEKKYEEPAAPKPSYDSHSYYVSLGTFESHYEASVKWQQIKGDKFDILKDVEPIIRVVASENGKGYQLLAGPLDKEKGIKLAHDFKTSLLSVDN